MKGIGSVALYVSARGKPCQSPFARLGGFERLRDLGIPDMELGDVACQVAERAGARSNPRPASAAEIEALLRSIW